MNLIPTILCGGAGSRLWPVSRETHPKPFIRLADGQSLLQKAFLRGATLPGATEVITVTNRELFFKTEDEYREVNSALTPTSYILEPFGRNTAPAIAAARCSKRAASIAPAAATWPNAPARATQAVSGSAGKVDIDLARQRSQLDRHEIVLGAAIRGGDDVVHRTGEVVGGTAGWNAGCPSRQGESR